MEGLSGPYVATALLCEKLMVEQDGVLSIIRMVDRFIRPRPTRRYPLSQFELRYSFVCGLDLWVPRELQHKKPQLFKPDSHAPTIEIEREAFLRNARHWSQHRNPILMSADEEGLYWIDVLFEGSASRVPLRVIFATVPTVRQPSASHRA